ncbi:sugar ABC transporter ATP-binding protein [Thermanaerothrix sp.]|jgi:ribose transport system ATP-binding protein|uniref:sugar ABC transporter ATP-binding protein n=1 Tax=Thermanaerothrix sp. TaxID=2972675 RepID=UPI002ADE3DE0|nr:sugar ABC transporter ATP-binding protein [Thermanaerothrix sp.]
MNERIPRLRLEHVSKAFPGVQAVNDVSLDVYGGEILALVGENGAGKSTLMNIINGVVPLDSGKIYLEGQPVTITSPRQALELGITMIHQELALIPQLTVGQNIFLGREPRRWRFGVDWKRLYAQAQAELNRLGIEIPVQARVADLTIAQRQLVEIAKALSYNARLIALDEPTSALTERETETLFRLVRTLRDQGVALIYISHRLEEVFELADRIAVMRDGQLVAVGAASEFTPTEVVRLMVGRELTEFFPKVPTQRGEPILRAVNLQAGREVRGVNLELHRGEIVGLAGLVGAGRTNLARLLFGADRAEAGEIWLDGQRVEIRSPRDAIRLGIGLVPEDRKSQGLFLGQSVRFNVAASLLERLSRLGFIHFRHLNQQIKTIIERLRVRTPSLNQRVRNLSGGNQQKVVISRWLTLNPKVLILDEPTRGVDVGAKAEIHALMSELAAQGMAILMISSELPEILGVSDRILVMREGRIVAEFNREEATQDLIMQAATGQLERRVTA